MILATDRIKLDMMPSILERLNARFRMRMICLIRNIPISRNSTAKMRDGSLSRMGWKILLRMLEVCLTSSPIVSTTSCTEGTRSVVPVAVSAPAVQSAGKIEMRSIKNYLL